MSKIIDFLSGRQILEEIDSPINGHLTVIRDLAWGVHIQGGGLTQSGGVAENVWRTSLREAKKNSQTVSTALIVGLGAGSIAKIIREIYPHVEIIGVDIDEVIVRLGKKHMGLGSYGVNINIEDGFAFVEKLVQKRALFDLICIDTYIEDSFPEKFASAEFLKNIKKILTKDGVCIFNRLYYGEKRPLAIKFLKKLESIFSSVNPVYPEANIMFVCSINK